MGNLSKPKVLQVIGSLGIGGAEKIGIAIAKEVSLRGWDSLVVSATGNRNLDSCDLELRQAGVRVEVLPDTLSKKIAKVATLTRHYQPDLVHVHTELPELLGMAMKVVVPRLQLVRTIHNQMRWPNHQALRQMIHWYYRLFSQYQYACAPAAACYGEPVIMNGVPWTNEVPDKDPYLVSFVGRMERQKNPVGVIEIVRLARAQEPRIHLRMVGGGSLLSTLQRTYSEEWIEWMGPRDDAVWHIGQSVVVAFASVYEGLPLVAIEALTRLTGVLAPDISGFHEMEWVTRYPSRDWKSASEKLLALIAGASDDTLSSARALNRERYSQPGMVQNYLSEYHKILYPGQMSSQENTFRNTGPNSNSVF